MNMVDRQLAKLGIALPHVPPPVANYVPFTSHKGVVTISGQLPRGADGLLTGCLGDGLPIDQGVEAARLCAIAVLAVLKEAVGGDFGRLAGCIQISGFVRSTSSFEEHSTVINGASDLLVSVLGEKGRHARAAIGVVSLPFGAAVEVSAQFQLADYA
ncbi:RidA family protein [Sphingorhabdus buctiana]|uniref:RidA family protein n=1 Tax=Sphingorhabdus buctiana TaxID=1508805 RepID=A0ABW4MED0_9SPHN